MRRTFTYCDPFSFVIEQGNKKAKVRFMRFMPPLAAVAIIALAACGASQDAPAQKTAVQPNGQKLNIYSARHYDSDRLLYKAFEDETGIKVNFRESGASQLLETMKAEGENSPADVIIASDAGTLYRFQDASLTQPIESDTLTSAIPPHFREENGNWFGLAKRARVIVYDPARLNPEDVDEYTDLADGKLQGELCMRSSTNIYNLSLMGELIGRLGEDGATAWTRSVVANFARPPQGGDTAQIESIAAGECSAALVNHYYWVRLAQSNAPAQRALTEKTRLSFPNQDTVGTHINVTAAAVAANAPNKTAAIQFIEFLTTPEGQALLTTETKEFPLVAGATLPSGLVDLPDFKESNYPLSQLGEAQAQAQAIYDRAGWN